MMPPVKRVTVDFTLDMLKELNAIARELNINRQAVIKTYLRQALDQHYMARQSSR
jgi:metal-responsive CopG/Arc/MetJ family transcriptional regulator